MGCIDNITKFKFPKQSGDVGMKVSVCFHYDTRHYSEGKIIRDDVEEPFVGIISLNNGRYILTSECQYTPLYD